MIETQPLFETVARRIPETLHMERIAIAVNRGGRFEAVFASGYAEAPSVKSEQGTGAVAVPVVNREPLRVSFGDPVSWLYGNGEMNGGVRPGEGDGEPEAVDLHRISEVPVREVLLCAGRCGDGRSGIFQRRMQSADNLSRRRGDPPGGGRTGDRPVSAVALRRKEFPDAAGDIPVLLPDGISEVMNPFAEERSE